MPHPIRRSVAVLLLLAGCFIATSGASAAPTAPPATSHFEPVLPVRLLDTRELDRRPDALEPVRVEVTSVDDLPADIVAAVVTVTATGPDGPGWVSAWPTGMPWPGTSSLNVVAAGSTVGGTVTVMLGADGAFLVQGSTATHLVVDLQGVYVSDDDLVGPGRFTPITPTRALDTRLIDRPLAPGTPLVVHLGSVGVPTDATGVVLTVAATTPAEPGFVTVWPGRGAAPWSSVLNFDQASRTVSNQVVVGVVDAEVSIQASAVTHVVVDVIGYFSPAEGGLFLTAAPKRLLDTRLGDSVTGGRPVQAGSVRLEGLDTVDIGVVTVTEATPGFVTVWPAGTPRPVSASANADGRASTVATQFTSATSGGAIEVYVSGSAHVVIDTVGTYTAAHRPPPNPSTTTTTTTTAPADPGTPRRPTTTVPRTTIAPTTSTLPATTTTTTTTTTSTTTPPPVTTTPPAPGPTNPEAGAQLPIWYDLAAEPNRLFVSPSGADTNPGTITQPLATLSAAVARATSGYRTTIVVRGGTYRQGQVTLPASKPITLIAYPGETPVFTGAQRLAGAWTDDGPLRWHPYTDVAVTNGSGISFTSGQNLAGDGVGKFADQAWIGDTQLRQVSTKGAVVGGTFWVDATTDRIYLTAADADAADIEASKLTQFLTINAADTRVEGITVRRYSNHAALYGTIRVAQTADRLHLGDVVIEDAAYQAVQLAGSSDILDEVTIERTTITGSNWMGVAASITDDLTLDRVLITGINRWGEFTTSPQSGALKTSRTWRTTVSNSVVRDNRVHGLWFDQSNYDITVANNDITASVGAGVFFEISDRLTMVNNRVTATGGARAVKIAGSSGVRLVNNTFVGGADPVGVYVDVRSLPGCSDPARPLCANSYSSDRDTVRPHLATLDWMPRIDLMIDNVIAAPTAGGYCGGLTAVCITSSNGTATVALERVLHPADSARGIPATVMDGNVYVSGSGSLMRTARGNWSTLDAIRAGLSASPMTLTGAEANGFAGAGLVHTDGTPTATLAALHGQATPVPTDPQINAWIPAGTRHYGSTLTPIS